MLLTKDELDRLKILLRAVEELKESEVIMWNYSDAKIVAGIIKDWMRSSFNVSS